MVLLRSRQMEYRFGIQPYHSGLIRQGICCQDTENGFSISIYRIIHGFPEERKDMPRS